MLFCQLRELSGGLFHNFMALPVSAMEGKYTVLFTGLAGIEKIADLVVFYDIVD